MTLYRPLTLYSLFSARCGVAESVVVGEVKEASVTTWRHFPVIRLQGIMQRHLGSPVRTNILSGQFLR
jgi:hypothetical protein